MPMAFCTSRKRRWYFSNTSRGVLPSLSAVTMIGVPCESDPDTITTRLPFSRWHAAIDERVQRHHRVVEHLEILGGQLSLPHLDLRWGRDAADTVVLANVAH